QVETNSQLFSEFVQSLKKCRDQPQQLLAPDYYFKNLFLNTYKWCMSSNLYGLAAEILETKRDLALSLPTVKFDNRDRIALGFAYSRQEKWHEALATFDAAGEIPVTMETGG